MVYAIDRETRCPSSAKGRHVETCYFWTDPYPIMVFRSIQVALLVSLVHVLCAQQPVTHWWAPDNAVLAAEVHAEQNTLYLAGQFEQIGPRTPYHVELDPVTAQPITGPQSDEQVLLHVPDGSGGWYGIGYFTRFGAERRNGLVRMNEDGTLHPWYPQVDGRVRDLAYQDGVVYLVGEFTQVNGIDRAYAAAVDGSTGALLPWDPQPNGPVNGLAVVGGTTYLGGAFTLVNGQARTNLCSVSTPTADVLAWSPPAVDVVRLVRANEFCIVARVGSQLRCFDAAGSQVSSPPASTFTNDVELVQDTVYVAGQLGQQHSVHAFPLGGDIFLELITENIVHSISVSGNSLYLGGDFLAIQGTTRYRAAQIHRISGVLAPWSPQLSNFASEVQSIDGRVFVSGGFYSATGQRYTGLAAMDLATGEPAIWAPPEVGSVQELAVYGDVLFVAGGFATVDGEARSGLAAYDLANNVLLDWAPVIDIGTVTDLTIVGDTLYIAGTFSTFNGQPRSSIAAVLAATGELLSWAPSVTNNGLPYIEEVIGDGNAAYFYGSFNTVGGVARPGIAAVDRNTGAVLPWLPQIAPGAVFYDMALDEGKLFIAHPFIELDGTSTMGITALDAGSGSTLWHTPTDPEPRVLGVTDSTVFITGSFTTVGDEPRAGIAQVHRSDGIASAWNIAPEWCAPFSGQSDLLLPAGSLMISTYSISTDSIVTSPYLSVLSSGTSTGLPAVKGDEDRLRAFPNPTAGRVELGSIPPTSVLLDVLDGTGRLVQTGWAASVVDITTLHAGAYIIRLRDGSGNTICHTQVVLVH